MADVMDLVSSMKTRQRLEVEAKARFSSVESTASFFTTHAEKMHLFYAPPTGDQWPEDRKIRYNKLHITDNMVQAFCDIEARLLSLLPRFTQKPSSTDLEVRRRAESVEKVMMGFLEVTGVESWMFDFNLAKSIYGISYLHPFWNEKEDRPDVEVIEQPQNLRVGWGTSDYKEIDWTIYRYGISPVLVQRRYPHIKITIDEKSRDLKAMTLGFDHTDPLNQRIDSVVPLSNYNPSEYEGKQVEIWDYWYVDEEGTVQNCVFVQGTLAEGPTEHPELPVIPYIPCENGHEPGNPMGKSTALLLIDLQMAYNRMLSSFAQEVWDNSGPSWQLTGENADAIPEGTVPKSDEVVPTGINNEIKPISKPLNNFPVSDLLERYWSDAERLTGLPKILFGEATSDESGRARTIQIEAAKNRLEPKRNRTYDALKALLLIWGFMLEKKNPKVTVSVPTEDGTDVVDQKVGLGDLVKGMGQWKIIAPEMTPRDSAEKAVDMANRVAANLLPLEWAMDELGVENPQEALSLIRKEHSDPRLFPEKVQAFAALMATVQSIVQNEMMLRSMQGQNPQAMANQGAGSIDAMMAAGQQAQPTLTEDMNQVLPRTGPGSPPPPGASAPGGLGGQLQQLIRQTPGGESQAMSQIALSTEL